MTILTPVRGSYRAALVVAIAILFISSAAHSAEKVTLKLLNGQTSPCDVVKVTKDGVVAKPVGGTEQTLPLERMDPKEVVQCYHQSPSAKEAASHFDLGNYFFKKHLFNEAEEALNAAVKLDASLKAKS